MTDKLKKFLTGTFLCVSTFSSLNFASSAFAVQDVEPAKSTLEALLESSTKRGSTSSLTQVEQVTYNQSDQSNAGPNALQPLLPKLPTPPKFRPTPLLPSLAAGSDQGQVSAPVVQQVQPRVPVSRPESGQSSIVPIVSGTKAPSPIISAPLPQQSTAKNSFAYPAVPVRPQSTVPVVNGQAVTQAVSKAPRIQTKPMIPTIPSIEVSTAQVIETAKTEIKTVSSPVKSTADGIVTTAQQEIAKSTNLIEQAANSTPNIASSASRAGQSLEQAIAEAHSEITGDEIHVEEVSTDQLMSMIMGPGKIKASNASAPKSKSTQQRVATIGSGTTSNEDTALTVSTTQEVFSGSAPAYLNAPCDTGYGYDAQRPDMPSCLPYDGCGSVSGASGYAFVDFLYMDRDKGDFSASLLPANDAYDYTPGARFRFGRKYDSIEGWEAGFTILNAHTANTQILSPTNSLSPRLFPTDGFTLGSISSFNGASFHENFQKSHYYSAELNKMSWNWDVMSSFIGLRYTGIDDLYGLNSIGAGGDFGTYRLRARNHLFGPQIGGELFYDIGRRLSFSVTGKLGGYVNFYQTNTEFANNNVRIIDNSDDDVDFSWSTEMGVFARYMLTPRAKLKVGYEFWYFDNVASAQGQYNGFITPFSGLNSSNSDNALYHGASFGLEWYR